MTFEITQGKIAKAKKVVIYGPEGIGKSTFASQFPDPVFIDTEGSTNSMDVRRYPKPTSWQMLLAEIDNVLNTKPCKTLVIDTVDWAEALCLQKVCADHQKNGIEDFGYGNGYVYEKEEFGKFLNRLSDVVDAGINVVLTAHAQLRKFNQPDEIGEYDRWELKLGKKTGSVISPLVKEWSDLLLFANYKTLAVAVDKDGKKFKGRGGSRVMYTEHHPCWDAKNRFGLEPELPFKYDGIAHLFEKDARTETPVPVPAPVQDEDKYWFDAEAHILKKQKTQPTPDAIEVSQKDYEELLGAVKQTQTAEKPTKKTAEKPKKAQEEPTVPVEEPVQDEAEDAQDGIPKELRDLMTVSHVTELEVRRAMAAKGYYPQDTPIETYDPAFIAGVLVGAWDKVTNFIKDMRENDDTPFNME